jgi:hypothetical protein
MQDPRNIPSDWGGAQHHFQRNLSQKLRNILQIDRLFCEPFPPCYNGGSVEALREAVERR